MNDDMTGVANGRPGATPVVSSFIVPQQPSYSCLNDGVLVFFTFLNFLIRFDLRTIGFFGSVSIYRCCQENLGSVL
jgi:hypothetical protein